MDICNNCNQDKDLHKGRRLYCTDRTAEVFTPLRCNYRYNCKCEPEDKVHPDLGRLCSWHWRVVTLDQELQEDPMAKIDIQVDNDLVAQHKDEEEMR